MIKTKTTSLQSRCTAIAAALVLCGGAGAALDAAAQANPDVTKINKSFMISQDTALAWNTFKSQGGPTYAGSPSGVRYANFLLTTAQELGLVDIDFVDIPYQRYVVNDWPDVRTHQFGTGVEIEKLVSDGVGVPVVASYGMTSGGTTVTGPVTAPMIYYDPANPPSDSDIKGKILVAKTVPYPAPVPNVNGPYAYSSSILGSYTETDYIYRSPGKWSDPYKPIPAKVSSSQWGRWVWSQLGGYEKPAIRAGAVGMVVVYDLSPAMALGVTERSVYSTTGNGGPGTVYVNVPTLTLDRVNGAKVLQDAKAGKSATLTLNAFFETSQGKEIIGYLPGKDYGTPADRQILIATHQDAMSLSEENGGLGMLGVLNYFNHIPQAQRPRTIVFWFDNRHFMPGGEGAWGAYDYYKIHPEKAAPLVATMGMEHMGAKATIETGVGGNDYVYSTAAPKDGGVITSYILMDPTEWMFKQIKQAAEQNSWVRVEAKTNALPGMHGGYQSPVKSPLTKGGSLNPKRPSFGLAGDWPGAATQTYAQLMTMAQGAELGFDPDYFVQQVAGMSQVVGNLMVVDPIVIDLGWGPIRAGIQCTMAAICSAPASGFLPDSKFVDPSTASVHRQLLLQEYLDMTEQLEQGHYDNVRTRLQQLKADVTTYVSDPNRTALNLEIDTQIAKLP
jgi:hypothetical protein